MCLRITFFSIETTVDRIYKVLDFLLFIVTESISINENAFTG